MTLNIVAFVAFIAGSFILLNIRPGELITDLKSGLVKIRQLRKPSLRQQVKMSTQKKKIRGIRKILLDSKAVLKLTGRMDRMPFYTTASIILFFTGVLISALLNNYFNMLVLGGGLSLIPWLYILASSTVFKKRINSELETSLGMITISYMRIDSFPIAVEENLPEMQSPVKDVFEKFVVQTKLVSSNIPALLEEMKDSIDNATFQDWVEQVIQCQNNRALKSTLQPIVNRFSDVREVSGKLNNLLYEPLKEYITLAVIMILNYPFFYTMSRDWYDALFQTTQGQLLVTGTFVYLFLSLIGEVRNTRPVEYRR